MSRPIRLCFVNRNFPPQKGATGDQAAQLIDRLSKEKKFEIYTVSVHSGSDSEFKLYVKERYSGKSKIRRFWSALIESYQLVKKAKSLPADIYFILTDPPFLNFWATLHLKKDTWINWTMDLYPEAFVANKLVSPGNMLFKYYQSRLRAWPPKYLICLGPEQSRFLKKQYYQNLTATILPAGLKKVKKEEDGNEPFPKWFDPQKITIGYVGSVGEAHDAGILLEIVQNLDPETFRMVLSCYGSKAEYVLREARKSSSVVCLGFLPENQMSLLDVQIVTLLPEWTHICVPSKALSALSHRNAVLFIGEHLSDTWHFIKDAGWQMISREDLIRWIRSLTRSEVEIKRNFAERTYKSLLNQRDKAYAEITEELEKLTYEIP